MTDIGIIGCGKMANSHVTALMQFENVKIAAVCDTDMARASKLAKKTDANFYTSYEKMLEDESLSLVIICLPPALHGACTQYCARKGVNVFIEKPMGLTVDDCREMLSVCNENGVMLWVGHMQRYSKENQIAKELVDSGEYGKLISISEVRTCAYPGPASPEWLMNKNVAGGGIMYNFGAHTIDMVKYISGSKIVLAECNANFTETGAENAASGYLELENGVSVTFNLMGACAVNRYEIVLYLTNGEIRIKPRKSIVACTSDGVFKKIHDETDEKNIAEETWQQLQLRDVIDSLGSGKAKVSGEYGLEIIEVIEKLYKSAETK